MGGRMTAYGFVRLDSFAKNGLLGDDDFASLLWATSACWLSLLFWFTSAYWLFFYCRKFGKRVNPPARHSR
jgi:hypothetical protein